MKILIPIKTYSNTSFLILIMNSILKELRKKIEVEEFWFVYTKGEKTNSKEKIKILYIDDFDNAKKVLEKVKPDLIHVWPTYTPIDYSFTLAAKKLKIPILGGFHRPFANETASFGSYLKLIFEKTIPTDNINSKRKNMKRGRFFVFKFWFLLKTQISLKRNPIDSLIDILIICREILKHETIPINSRFAVSAHWIGGEDLIKPLIKSKFRKETIFLTGNPVYDEIVNQTPHFIPNSKKESKIRVLFAPSTPFEHGFTSRSEQDKAMKDIIKNIIKKKSEIILTVKIHPSSAVYSEYKELIDDIDPNIILKQEGGILDYLNESDILITYPDTSLIPLPLFLKKPIILYNFYNAKNSIFLDKELAFECKDTTNITTQIIEIISNKIKIKGNADKFIKDYLYRFDGLASERISNLMLDMMHKNSYK